MKKFLILIGIGLVTMLCMSSCDYDYWDEWRCPNCGAINDSWNNWCWNCGWG